MEPFVSEGMTAEHRVNGVQTIRFWAAADTWDRATITVRVNYREWMAAFAALIEIVEVGAERRYSQATTQGGPVRPHVETMITYRRIGERANPTPPAPSPAQVVGERTKTVFAPRTCQYCQKEFVPTGASQRFCDEVCRSWYNVEQAELRAAERGLNRDKGGL